MEKNMKSCPDCGAEFTPTCNRQKRCITCGKKRKLERIKEWNHNHREHLARYKKEYYSNEQHKAKHQARCKALSAQRRGKLKKAEKCAVNGCQCTDDLQFHHVEYGGKWGAICVITLCKKHHYLEHMEAK